MLGFFQVEDEVRVQVDELMREELKNLQMVSQTCPIYKFYINDLGSVITVSQLKG